MNKRILIIRRYKGFGGIEHQIKTLSTELIKHGWKVFLLTDAKSPFSVSMEAEGVNVSVAPFGNTLHTARMITSLCRKEEIAIVQSHMLNEDFRCRIAKLLMPKLRHVFRVHTYIDCSNISRFKKNLYHIASKITDPLVDVYISINEFNVQELKNRTKINKNKIVVIHDAVRDLQNIKDLPQFKRTKHLAMVANFDYGKGHDVALKAISILKKRGEEFTLRIIGGVPGFGTNDEDNTVYNQIRELTERLELSEQIVFEGFCSNIETILEQCDCVILPSYAEGTPNCLLEGMLLGKIVISSNVGGVPEFVFDKKTGFTFFPNNENCLAKTISLVYSYTNEELNSVLYHAQKLVMEEYSKETVIELMNDVYISSN